MNNTGCDRVNDVRMEQPEANTTQPTNTIRDIRILQLDYGYVVHVGCKKFAIENRSILISLLDAYTKSPQVCEKEFFKGASLSYIINMPL